MKNRSYSELMQFSSYQERLEYLKLLDNNVNSPRGTSGEFFRSTVWRRVRDEIIHRDSRFDLGVFGLYIDGAVYVHHINPITKEDIDNMTHKLMSPENLICVSLQTHNAIHYKQQSEQYTERQPGDTKAW